MKETAVMDTAVISVVNDYELNKNTTVVCDQFVKLDEIVCNKRIK